MFMVIDFHLFKITSNRKTFKVGVVLAVVITDARSVAYIYTMVNGNLFSKE